MRKTVTIQKITSKMVDTKWGKKKKLNLQVKSDKGLGWVDGFAGPVTDMWSEGDTVVVDISSREYNGKTYYSFKAPRLEELVLAKLDQIIGLLIGKKMEEVEHKDDVELPRLDEPEEEFENPHDL